MTTSLPLLSGPYSPTASCAVAGGQLPNQYDSGQPFNAGFTLRVYEYSLATKRIHMQSEPDRPTMRRRCGRCSIGETRGWYSRTHRVTLQITKAVFDPAVVKSKSTTSSHPCHAPGSTSSAQPALNSSKNCYLSRLCLNCYHPRKKD